jgi:hypothetical protein
MAAAKRSAIRGALPSFSSKDLFLPNGVVGGFGKGLSFSDIIPSLDALSFYYTIDETGESVAMGKQLPKAGLDWADIRTG